MKQRIAAIAITAALSLAVLPTAALAHGHHGAATRQSYALCNVDQCNTTGLHLHDGTYYCGHTLDDGHTYHQACTVAGCTEICAHEHNGVPCLPQAGGGGHHAGHTGRGHR